MNLSLSSLREKRQAYRLRLSLILKYHIPIFFREWDPLSLQVEVCRQVLLNAHVTVP